MTFSMNRREFLKTLIAIGGAVSLPLEALEHAPESVIDAAWTEAQADPRVFYVNAWGALSDRPGLEGFDFVQDRRDLFRLGDTPSPGQALVAFIESNSDLDDVAYKAFEDFSCDYWRIHGDDDCPFDTWQAWAQSDDCADLLEVIEAWLGELPDDTDYAGADIAGLSCRGDALYFFANRSETADLLDVDITDSNASWHTDYCAMLRISCEEANARATDLGLPICFEQWEV
jgi:hypothetical protein